MSGAELLIASITIVLMLVGFFGILQPLLPGLYLIWTAMFFHAIVTKFNVVSSTLVLLLGAIVVVVYLVERRITRHSVHEFQVSGVSIIGALLGAQIALAFGIWPALTIGPLFGALLFGLLAGRDTPFTMQHQQFVVVGYWGLTLLKLLVGGGIIAAWFTRVLLY